MMMAGRGGENPYPDWSFDKMLDASGVLIDGEGWATSDYLPVNNVVNGKRANASTERVVTACFYNEDLTFNKVFKTRTVNTGNMYGNSGYKYIRYVVKASDIDDCYLRYTYGTQDYLFKGKNV
jgi:hypothetical protein